MNLLPKIIYFLARYVKKIFSLRSALLDIDDHVENEFREALNFNRHFKGLSYQRKTVLDIGCGFGGALRNYNDEGTHLCCGIEIDKNRANFAGKNIRKMSTGSNRCAVVVADARYLPVRKDAVDLMVSKATFEHVKKLDMLLQEAHRVLKPGGKLYASWSPAWFTYNGGHLWNYLPIPWLHILMPTKVIISALKHYYGSNDRDFPKERIDYIIELFQSLVRLSCHSFRRYVIRSSFKKYKIQQFSSSKLKKILTCVPVFDEVFAGSVYCILTK